MPAGESDRQRETEMNGLLFLLSCDKCFHESFDKRHRKVTEDITHPWTDIARLPYSNNELWRRKMAELETARRALSDIASFFILFVVEKLSFENRCRGYGILRHLPIDLAETRKKYCKKRSAEPKSLLLDQTDRGRNYDIRVLSVINRYTREASLPSSKPP